MTPEQIHLIIQDEIGAEYPNDKRYYNAKCASPIWAGGGSGVTIGIGFDLGFNTKAEITKAWGSKVNGNHLVYFLECSGIKGIVAKKKIGAISRSIKIPYEIAIEVFMESSLPKFTKLTKSIYPNLDNLNDTTQAILIGLVYNRGASLKDKEGSTRRVEMRELVDATNKADYAVIAALIHRMKRLWVGTDVSGLVERRENESKLILNSIA